MDLTSIRKQLDKLDFEILKLLNTRMELALKTKKFKSETTDSGRENDVLNNIKKNSRGLIAPDFCEKLYLEIIAESKKLQNENFKLIGFQGEHGAYSEVAAKHWSSRNIAMPCADFSEVFAGVNKGLFDYGIVPVENNLGGVISEVNQLLLSNSLQIVGAVKLPVRHCLIAPYGIQFGEIRVALSHGQALAQCRTFLADHHIEARPYYDTAGAVRRIAEQSPEGTAAIASRLAAEYYNLNILKENIEDLHSNTTRFFILAKKGKKSGEKCSIAFKTRHKAGTLFHILEIFAKRNINLTRIESMPDTPGDYAFFLDFVGSIEDENVKTALAEAEKNTRAFKFLGSYREIQG